MTETKPPPALTAALIVAAGRGTRAGGATPKQWRMLSGTSVAERSLRAFQDMAEIDLVVLALHPQEMHRAAEFPGTLAVAGGDSRAASVKAGLAALAGQGVSKVLIHDVARPLVTRRIILDVIEALQHTPGAAPALAVTDALWRGADGLVRGTEERAGLFRAQTPQGFDYAAITAAHAAMQGDFADDVEVARAFGLDVAMVPGDERNMKLTWAPDFDRAAALVGGGMDLRFGNGFDVHRFGDGDHVTLCGVDIPHERGLSGHSDADVAMHAVTDAIYGALAEGDIGRHFPPSDPQWKGADSAIFLRHAVELAASRGYRIGNIDVTIICEFPKIGPHAEAMIERMTDLMGLEAGRVSVKATTSERLGFTGRQEGIAALASATVIRA